MTRRWHADEGGSGPIPTAAGFLVFMLFLLLATQTLLHLFATSTAGTAVFETARRVATGQFDCGEADAHVKELLGGWGQRDGVTITCRADDQVVTVGFTGPSPAQLVEAFTDVAGLQAVSRSATVRREIFS